MNILDHIAEESRIVSEATDVAIAERIKAMPGGLFKRLKFTQIAYYLEHGYKSRLLAIHCANEAENHSNENCIVLLEAMGRLSHD